MIDSPAYRRPTRSPPRVVTAPTVHITNWRPLAQMMVAGWALIVVGGRSSTLFRLSLAAAAVAATTAFVFDDPGAETVAASPTSLIRRRLQRVTITTFGVGVWWVAAVLLARQLAGSSSGFAVVDATLEMSVLVAIALGVSAVASRLGDRTGGGIAGAVTAMACFASTLLPHRSWLPLPADGAPNPTTRLTVLLVVATAVILLASTDPAHRQPVPLSRWRDRGTPNAE